MVGCDLSVAVVPDASLLIEQSSPSVELAFNREPIGELFVARWDGRGLWPCWEWEGCHCLFVGISLGYGKTYFRSCSTMKRVEPAPTISPMI